MNQPTPIVAGSYRQLEDGTLVPDAEVAEPKEVEESTEPKAGPKAPTTKKR